MGRRVVKGDPKRAVGYLRVSTEEQHNGPEVQRTELLRWAQREGVTLVAWFEDHGVGGSKGLVHRPGLSNALEALRTEGAGLLAVQKRDRLARDVMLAETLERAVARAGARVVSAAGEGEGDDPGGKLQRGIINLFAQYELDTIRDRTRKALQSRRARGLRAGTVPFGYTADPEGRLSPAPEEQAVLARVRQLRAAGRSLRAIVSELEAEHLVGRTQKPLKLTQVVRFVRAVAPGVSPATPGS